MAERTKLWIADHMKALMRQKPLEKIRVTEICRAAEIDRTTFYYHFQDKYDLVAWIFIYDAADVRVNDPHSTAEILERIRNNYLFYKRAYEDDSQYALWRYMVEYFQDRYAAAAKEILGVSELDEQMAYGLRVYCYGCVNMTREWVMTDKKHSALEIVEMMYKAMPKDLYEVFFGGRSW